MRYQFPGGFDTYGNSLQTAQDNINQEIRKTYQGVSNYRLGGEIKLTKYFMVRAGFGYYGNAYTPYGEANNSFYTTQRIDLSAGLGFHFRHFFTDLGLVHSMYTGYEQPYNVDYSGVVSGPQTTIPQAKIDYSIDNLALTVGFKFR
jgi:long-subunit fatty acid transport protein